MICAKTLPHGGQKQKFGVAHTKVFLVKKNVPRLPDFEGINSEIKVRSQ